MIAQLKLALALSIASIAREMPTEGRVYECLRF